MRIYDYAIMTPEERRTVLGRSTADIFQQGNIDAMRAIFEEVRRHGDGALVSALQRFDGASIERDEIRVSPNEVAAARRTVSREVQNAIAASIDAVRRYNERLMRGGSWLEELGPGVLLGEKCGPIDRVGLYVPCNKGTFPSVLVQIGTPAVVAGVREIAIVLPPKPGPSSSSHEPPRISRSL
jgi:histidinol dehydrogenase